MANVGELMELRRVKAVRAKELQTLGEREQRDLTAIESKEFDDCLLEVESCTKRIERQSKVTDLSKPNRRLTDAGTPDNSNACMDDQSRQSTKSQWRDAQGREVRVLGPGESLRRRESETSENRQLNLGRCLAAATTARWDDCTDFEVRTMLAGDLPSGGYALPSPLSNEIFDLARAQSTIFKAGARVIPMESDTLDFAKLTGDATMSYKSESGSFAESGLTFTRVRLVPKMFGCVVPVSRELLDDTAANFQTFIVDSLVAKIVERWDNHIIQGDGTSTYGGIVGLKGATNTVTSAGSIATNGWTKWLTGLQSCLEDNVTPNAVLLCPRDTIGLSSIRVDTGAGQYLLPPPRIAAMQLLETTAITATEGGGGNESSSYILDGTKVIVGLRQGTTLEFSTEEDDSFEKHQMMIKIFMRFDVGLSDANAVCRVSGILA